MGVNRTLPAELLNLVSAVVRYIDETDRQAGSTGGDTDIRFSEKTKELDK